MSKSEQVGSQRRVGRVGSGWIGKTIYTHTRVCKGKNRPTPPTLSTLSSLPKTYFICTNAEKAVSLQA